MFDMTFAFESLKRRWWVIALAAVLACGLGLVTMLTQKEEPIVPRYTAEAVVYLNADDMSEADALYLGQSHSYISNDARRIVLNDSVAGEVRRTMGETVTISTPLVRNDLTRAENQTHFVFIDATANTEEEALEAANMAAELAVTRISEEMDGLKARISEQAAVKTRTDGVANFGADSLTAQPIEQTASSFSFKKLVIFAGAGLIVGIAGVLLVEYCRRRIRSAHDVERLLGVPVIESLNSPEAENALNLQRCAGTIDVLAKRNGAAAVSLVGWAADETPKDIVGNLNAHLSNTRIAGWTGLSSAANDADSLSKSDALVLVLEANSQKAHELDEFAQRVALLNMPVLGALFVER